MHGGPQQTGEDRQAGQAGRQLHCRCCLWLLSKLHVHAAAAGGVAPLWSIALQGSRRGGGQCVQLRMAPQCHPAEASWVCKQTALGV